MVRLGRVNPIVWDEITEKLNDVVFDELDLDDNLDWRVNAANSKLDREMFQRYGVWKDVILHPSFQYCKEFLESNVDFNWQVGEPLVPFATSIVLLFMLHKRISNSALALVASLFFSLNPFYVILSLLLWRVFQQQTKPKQFKPVPVNKNDLNKKKPEIPINNPPSLSTFERRHLQEEFDHVLIGGDIGTLFAAALLTRVGHRCCVLMPRAAPPLSVHPAAAPCAVPLVNASCGRVDKYKHLLDTVCAHVSFTPIGNEQNSYLSCVIKQHQQTLSRNNENDNDENNNKGENISTKKSKESLWLLQAGKNSIIDIMETNSSLDKHTIVNFVNALVSAPQFVYSFLFSKVSPTTTNPTNNEFLQLATNPVASLVAGLKSDELFGVMSVLALFGAEEALLGGDCAGLCLASTIAHLESGLFHASGGVSAVVAALIDSITSYGSGSMVFEDVAVTEICVEEETRGVKKTVGVRVDVQETTISHNDSGKTGERRKKDSEGSEQEEDDVLYASNSIISGVGVLRTMLGLVAPEHLTAASKSCLSQLSQARPKMHWLFWLRGSSSQLQLSDADYIETIALTADQNSSDDNKNLARSYCRVWSPSMKDKLWQHQHGDDLHVVVVEMEAVAPFSFATQHVFKNNDNDDDNDKDSDNGKEVKGPIVYKAPKEDVSASAIDVLRQKAESLLFSLYPRAQSSVIHSHFVPPHIGVSDRVSNTVDKFQSPITVTTHIQNLFLAGSDVATMGFCGEIQGGWVAANAVLGYNINDLQSGRNVAADIAFLSP